MLGERLELGLGLLKVALACKKESLLSKYGELEEEGMEWLWCVLVCLHHTRYLAADITDSSMSWKQ